MGARLARALEQSRNTRVRIAEERPGEEAAFLTEVRSPEKESVRLRRIQHEFVRGFQGLYDLGPAVTVFGSARFKEHP